ncbi:MAG: RNA methyltransferase [Gemmatimonadetes bacterium]|nr:MAG: RNA methyltransferase [Gemmatimonadota bacterium]
MYSQPLKPLYLALMHYPAVNRHGDIITATVEYFDFFDMSRVSLTYPLQAFYIVNPLASQREFARHLLRHGSAREQDVKRNRVFSKTRVAAGVPEIIHEVVAERGKTPLIIATSAKRYPQTITFAEVTHLLESHQPVVLLFGKAWGMPPEFVQQADYVLEPVDTGTGYNHLSVRSAVSIIVDRLFR